MLPPRRQAPRTHPPDRYARAPLLPVLPNAKLYPSKLATQISSRNPHFHAKIGCAATAAAAPHTLSSPFEQAAPDVGVVSNRDPPQPRPQSTPQQPAPTPTGATRTSAPQPTPPAQDVGPPLVLPVVASTPTGGTGVAVLPLPPLPPPNHRVLIDYSSFGGAFDLAAALDTAVGGALQQLGQGSSARQAYPVSRLSVAPPTTRLAASSDGANAFMISQVWVGVGVCWVGRSIFYHIHTHIYTHASPLP